jgi:hypothetical protein
MRDVVARHAGILAVLAVTLGGQTATAQDVAGDPSARLAAVLPEAVAQHVLALIKSARAEGLPADALANRSLKFAARGIAPSAIAHAADDQLARMRTARDAIRSARPKPPMGDEIEAGAEALREGVSPGDVAAIAASAPSGRSLAVPLYVIGSLASAGVPSGEALQRVEAKLKANASDADIEADGRDAAASHRPADAGRGHGAGAGQSGGVGAPAHGGGPPAGVPGNAGQHGRPTTPPGQSHKPPSHGHP